MRMRVQQSGIEAEGGFADSMVEGRSLLVFLESY